ncbi:MAG: cupin domain-containing protein, partial [Planctomycetota bacterium]
MASHSIPLPPRAESAEDVVRLLDLKPHIEGGFYRETWRDPTADASRGRGTAVY